MVKSKSMARLRAGDDVDIVRKPAQAESIVELYGGEEVSIFLDGTVGRRTYSDFEHEEVVVFDGIVQGAHGDMLILLYEGAEILINGWLIKAVMKKNQGSLTDILNINKKKKSRL